MSQLTHTCSCKKSIHHCELIVITGGPGAGKTAVLELARRKFCEHVRVLPEAASIIFGGGFPREDDVAAKKSAQRAIFHVETELEKIVIKGDRTAIALCDRGTLDGLAYWPNSTQSFFDELLTTEESELAKYSGVIHLRPPAMRNGYNHSNPIRIENADEAQTIDKRIEKAWQNHPHRHIIEATDDFLSKATIALDLIESHLPDCCKRQTPAAAGGTP